VNEISSQLDEARERLRSQTPTPYLTVEEAAQLARCHPKTIHRAQRSGELRSFRPAHRILLKEEDVRAWIEAESERRAPRPRPAQRPRRAQPGSVSRLRDIERGLT
jgi:excisionase family DNA binding protein